MKNKKALFLLLPLVVIIWGLVLYRLMDFGGDDQEGAILNKPASGKKEEKKIQKDTFSIVANYRDPFLGTLHYKKARKTQAIVTKKKSKFISKSKPLPVQWPAIAYGGIIKNQQSNQQIAIVTVGEREGLLAVNEELMGIQLKKIYNKDSIEVSFFDNRKVIRKQ